MWIDDCFCLSIDTIEDHSLNYSIEAKKKLSVCIESFSMNITLFVLENCLTWSVWFIVSHLKGCSLHPNASMVLLKWIIVGLPLTWFMCLMWLGLKQEILAFLFLVWMLVFSSFMCGTITFTFRSSFIFFIVTYCFDGVSIFCCL